MNEYKFDRAWSSYLRGQHKQAISILKDLLAEDPNQANYHGLLSMCLLAEKRIHAAEYELNIALNLNPLEPTILLCKAQVLVFKKQFNQALEACDSALSADSLFLSALLFKATIYSLLENRRLQLECLQGALAMSPDNVDVVCAMGTYLFSTGKLDEAFDIATQALNMDAQNEGANLLMARVSLALGNVEDANYHTKFVILRNPDSTEALTLFSSIKMQQSAILGIWWRLNTKLSTMGDLKLSFILISGFIMFGLCSQLLIDFNYPIASKITSFAWLGIVLYSWIGIPLYYKKLKNELEKFQFRSDF